MKRFALLGMAAVMALSAPVLAQNGPMGGPGGPRGPMPDPYGDATVAKADATKTAGERFDAIDTNHDGTLSGDEQDAAMNGPGGRGLRRSDLNADGKITKAEYLEAAASRFDMMDADHDGQLTKAERDAFREKMRARMGGGGGMGGGGWGGPPPEGGSGQ